MHGAVVEHERRDLGERVLSISSACGLVVAATVRTQLRRSTRPSSCALIMTLRTNGERGDQCSFIRISLAHLFAKRKKSVY
jgi:hypothetical protein